MASPASSVEGGSQTLSRGLTALEIIGDSTEPLSIAALSAKLGIHRSMGYRLVNTLELHGFVEKLPSGGLQLGIKLSSLARRVSKTLQSAAAPELRAIAEKLNMTAFLVTYDGEAAVTLSNAQPQNAETTLAKKPGGRHSIDKGAPGKVLRSQLDPLKYPPQLFESSHDEVLPGVASIAVPLKVPGGEPAAIAVIYLPQEIDQDQIAQVLIATARRIELVLG